MMDADSLLILTLGILAGLMLLSGAALHAWSRWIGLKRLELASGQSAGRPGPDASPSAMSRIELADLKERVKKLEAIAAGVDP
jgi:hypothetical protein